MTISTTASRILYNGNGVTTVFSFPYRFLTDSDLAVERISASGVTTLLSLGSDYTVSGEDTDTSGQVTCSVAPPSGSTLVIYRNIPSTQETDYISGDPFPAEAHERALDKLTMLVQQLEDTGDRVWTAGTGTPIGFNTEFPSPEAGSLLGWNDAETALTNISPEDLATTFVFSNWLYDVFTGDGTTVNFTLQANPANIANLDVSVDGVTQVPVTDYTLSATTLSFPVAPGVGQTILARYGQAAQQPVVSCVIENQTATAAQTVFTLTTITYVPGANDLSVYVNGLRMIGGGVDYSETNASTVTFTTGLAADDVVVFAVGDVGFGGDAGSGTADLGGTAIPDFSIDTATTDNRVVFSDTNPNGWNNNIGRMTVDFEMTSNDYFAANPNGHIAIGLRNTVSLIATAVRGQGVAIGNATGFGQPSDLNPTPLLESWFNSAPGAPADNFLWSNSESARSMPIEDGEKYRFIIDATKANDGNRYLRYRMWRWVPATESWFSEVDTGDVLDHNVWADLTQTGLVFAHVFNDDLVPWSLDFENVRVTWGPAENATPDVTTKLSRYGAELEGNLRFIGNGRRIVVNNDGTTFANWTAVQAKTTNDDTTLLVVPNGTSTVSNFLASNNSGLTNFSFTAFGMNGSIAEITTGGIGGGAAPDLRFVRNGVTKFTMTTNGLEMAGSSEAIGLTSTRLIAGSNYGGANASAFTTGVAFDFENTCTVGAIATFIGGAYNATNLENIIRPIYCYMSSLVADLQARKVI